MRVLVSYASKYGSTKGIAERIASTINETGIEAKAMPCRAIKHVGDYDAYVIGSAVYMFHWMKEASQFIRRNASALRSKPVWLFSSGPLGTTEVDSEGKDVSAAATPPEMAELTQLLHAREHHVFFGAYDASQLNLTHRLVVSMPGIKKLMIEGDYRNWGEVDAWSKTIAASLRESTAAEADATNGRVAVAAVAATAANAVVLPGAH